MRLNKGFSLIEVLIALIIITSAIITASSAYKQYASFRQRQSKYELIYMSVLSLKDKLENTNLSRNFMLTGSINGLKYTVKVERVVQKRNFTYGFEPGQSGNLGNFLLTLYKITINLAGRKFEFYETQYQKI